MRHHSAQLFMSEVKGVEQPKQFRDVFFALVFYAQLFFMMAVAAKFGPMAMAKYDYISKNHTDDSIVIVEYPHVLQLAIYTGFFACALSGLALFFMTVFSSDVIQICLIFSIVMSFAWGTIGIGLQPTSFVPITGIIALAFCIGYAFVVWSRIPFAAANLKCGLAGVKSTLAVAVIAYLCQIVALGWSIVWTFGLLGVYDLILGCRAEDALCQKTVHVWVYVGFGVSYYWTLQVIRVRLYSDSCC